MTKLTRVLKDVAIGILVPGSIGHQCARVMANWDIPDDIQSENRRDINYTLREKMTYGLVAGYIGLQELAFHAATIIPAIEKLNEGTLNSEGALIVGGTVATARAGMYLLYKAMRNETEESIQEALNVRAQTAIA